MGGGVFIDFTGDALPALKQISEKAERPKDLLDDIGAFLDMDVTTRFLQELTPGGTKWKKSKAAAERGGLTLTDNRDLAGSVTHSVYDDELIHGLGEKYAAIHHFGGETGRNKATKIEERPIIGIEAYQSGVIEEMVSDWLI